ncbi:MAG: hypothetical protein IAE77_30460 [Prosthecobacter sp.]|uniref:hypothetical protein n=1 Tax=Prosthecobacter sp. TaxID=1965333 RepID=UPI0019D9E903|nr:hypothetical protein [Prosthecobacter sp.]MBE2287820.1 hypothetical protein [Prosthecobacter sp.]
MTRPNGRTSQRWRETEGGWPRADRRHETSVIAQVAKAMLVRLKESVVFMPGDGSASQPRYAARRRKDEKTGSCIAVALPMTR